jgi:hypothetical protein
MPFVTRLFPPSTAQLPCDHLKAIRRQHEYSCKLAMPMESVFARQM